MKPKKIEKIKENYPYRICINCGSGLSNLKQDGNRECSWCHQEGFVEIPNNYIVISKLNELIDRVNEEK